MQRIKNYYAKVLFLLWNGFVGILLKTNDKVVKRLAKAIQNIEQIHYNEEICF